ncbi:hypothetical protein F1640_15110 [Novosphingobium sp. NBM11]|uniref:hypothetical protein n=1 Tax=Novosphingobium sp. NBM11 TaxID=2596914 RepID=UPI00189285A9|nr:hypothetical protein [Novosphingobium sp. NBM11]MBF5091315.1 hypothetical protein [Novosphingobium sp. NBM11]
MSRAPATYADAQAVMARTFRGVDASEPVAGFYKVRLGRDTIILGVRLWFGPPHDPETGEVMDRSWRWQAEANGEPIDFDTVWPKCAGEPVTEAEYRSLVARQAWARQHAPDSAYAERGRKVDRLSTSTPLPF